MRQLKAAVFAAVLGLGLLASMAQVSVVRGWAYGLFIDGTAALPSIAFASEPTTGFIRSASGSVAYVTSSVGRFLFNGSTGVQLGNAESYGWASTADATGASADLLVARGAAGVLTATGASGTNGIRLQFNGAPTAGTCGTSPSITSGSRDSAGSINVGTGGTATACTVNFNATWASAPFCTANGTTATPANVRALAVSTTTSAMTITAASAWVASEVVAWTCIGSK